MWLGWRSGKGRARHKLLVRRSLEAARRKAAMMWRTQETKKPKKQKTKKQLKKKTRLHTPRKMRREPRTWALTFCFFLVFWFVRRSLEAARRKAAMMWRTQETKKPKNQKKTKNKKKKQKKNKIAHTKEDEKRATDLGSDILFFLFFCFFWFFVFLFFLVFWFLGFLVSWFLGLVLFSFGVNCCFFAWCLCFCLHGLDFTPFLRTLVVPCSVDYLVLVLVLFLFDGRRDRVRTW